MEQLGAYWLMSFPASMFLRDPLFFDARDQLRQAFEKCRSFSLLPWAFAPAGGRQNVDSGAVERFFLYAVFALALENCSYVSFH